MKKYIVATDISDKQLSGTARGSDTKNNIYSFGGHKEVKLNSGVEVELGNSIATLDATTGEIQLASYGWISFNRKTVKFSKFTPKEFTLLYNKLQNMSLEHLQAWFTSPKV